VTPELAVAFAEATERARIQAPPRTTLCALGFATVELERAERSFGLAFESGAPDVLLGARTWIADLDGLCLVLLEPSTEGPLAASLARFGEGPLAAWYMGDHGADPVAGLHSPGPFGPESLLPGPRFGPHRLIVAPLPSDDDRPSLHHSAGSRG